MHCWCNPPVWPLLAFSLLGQPSLANATYALSLVDWNNISVQYVDFSAGLNPPELTWISQEEAVYSFAGDGEPNAAESATYNAYDFSTPLIYASQSIHAQSIAGRDSLYRLTESLSPGTPPTCVYRYDRLGYIR